ncbi:MAG: hypothetical protein KDA44_13150, partial [Planctomycetales bacterium]|nr:hypothetical protein [Planctomycetales bacterium]
AGPGPSADRRTRPEVERVAPATCHDGRTGPDGSRAASAVFKLLADEPGAPAQCGGRVAEPTRR